MGRRTRKEASSGFRVSEIAESDVNLRWNPRVDRPGLQLDAHAILLVIFFDSYGF